MSVREYIGARYMPVFADPIEWDITLTYEPLTVIKYQGTSYVSRRSVPEGIQVTNEDYWVRWADYNAQLEEYIRQVNLFDGRIDALEEGLPVASFTSESTVADRFESIEDVLPISEFDSTNTVDARFDAIEADSWVTTDRIADSAVTSAKIADGTIATGDIADSAVTSAKIADGTIATGDIADSAITSAKIADGAVNTADIANGAITNAKLADKYLVVIGDSYSNDAQTGTPLWHTRYAQAKRLKVYTNASDGVGFLTGSNTFSIQLSTAVSAMSGKDVREVIVMGGLNDFGNTSVTPAQIGTAANQLATAINSAFPNAEVTFAIFPPFQYYGFYTNGYSDKARAAQITTNIAYGLTTKNVRMFDMSNFGLLTPDFFGTPNQYGQAHPSSVGSTAIANALLGGTLYRNSYIGTGNCPTINALINGSHTNCSITNATYRWLTSDLLQAELTVTVTNPSAEARIDYSKLPRNMSDYVTIVDGSGNARTGYSNDSHLVIPATANATKYINILIPGF